MVYGTAVEHIPAEPVSHDTISVLVLQIAQWPGGSSEPCIPRCDRGLRVAVAQDLKDLILSSPSLFFLEMSPWPVPRKDSSSCETS